MKLQLVVVHDLLWAVGTLDGIFHHLQVNDINVLLQVVAPWIKNVNNFF